MRCATNEPKIPSKKVSMSCSTTRTLAVVSSQAERDASTDHAVAQLRRALDLQAFVCGLICSHFEVQQISKATWSTSWRLPESKVAQHAVMARAAHTGPRRLVIAFSAHFSKTSLDSSRRVSVSVSCMHRDIVSGLQSAEALRSRLMQSCTWKQPAMKIARASLNAGSGARHCRSVSA